MLYGDPAQPADVSPGPYKGRSSIADINFPELLRAEPICKPAACFWGFYGAFMEHAFFVYPAYGGRLVCYGFGAGIGG